MKELTHGFDVAAQISRHGITRCLRSFYGLVPPASGEEHVAVGDDKALAQVWFGLPDVTAAPAAGVPAAVKVRFPFTARLSTIDREETGYVQVVVSAAIDEVIRGATPVTQVVLRVGDVGTDSFVVKADGQMPAAVFADVLAPFIVRALRVSPQDVPLTPATDGFLDFRTYGPGKFSSALHHDPTPIPDFVGLFINRDGAEQTAPETFTPVLRQNYDRRDELVVMIPRETVVADFGAQLAALGLGTLPAPVPGRDDVTMKSIALHLDDGALRLTGSATLVNPVLDVTVGFTVVAIPRLSDGKLALTVVSSEVDLPGWAYALEYLVPVLGTFVVDLAADAARQALTSAVGGIAGSAAAGLGPFSDDLPEAKGFVGVALNGRVRVRPDGLLVYGALTVASAAAVPPPYILGNVTTLEFHRPGCEYLPGERNRVRFLTEAAALKGGYDGCRFCARDLDEDRLALLALRLQAPAGAFPLQVTVDGTRTGGKPGPGGVTAFHVEAALPADAGTDDLRTALLDRQRLGVLEPGDWSVTVSSGTWSAHAEVSLPRGSTVLLTGRLGQPGLITPS